MCESHLFAPTRPRPIASEVVVTTHGSTDNDEPPSTMLAPDHCAVDTLLLLRAGRILKARVAPFQATEPWRSSPTDKCRQATRIIDGPAHARRDFPMTSGQAASAVLARLRTDPTCRRERLPRKVSTSSSEMATGVPAEFGCAVQHDHGCHQFRDRSDRRDHMTGIFLDTERSPTRSDQAPAPTAE